MLLGVVWALAGAEVSAQETYSQRLNEVFQSDLVYPQDEGEVQVSLQPRFEQGREADVVQTSFGLEYGVTDAWQLLMEWDFLAHRDPETETAVQGPGDLSFGTMVSFMNFDSEGAHAAFGLEVALPVGDIDRELTEGFLEVEPFFVLARDFPDLGGLHGFVHAGLGLVHRIKTPSPTPGEEPPELEPSAHEAFVNAGGVLPVGPLLGVLELNWLNNEWNNGGETNRLFITPGLVWTFLDAWEAGVGVPIGLNRETPHYRMVFNLIYEFDT